jgi:hypothetical protein
MMKTNHYPRDGGDLPVPKAKRVYPLFDSLSEERIIEIFFKYFKH